MPWIKEFSTSITNFFKGQVIGAMQPLDFYHFFPLWYDLEISRIAQIIRQLQLDTKHFSDIADLLPPPSNLRSILKKLIVSYRGQPTHPADYRTVANFFARMLEESCPTDPFALTSNPFYSPEEFQKIIKGVVWQTADPLSARQIGQLITAAGSLVHGLYNDVVTDFGWDSYGPYSIQHHDATYTSLIRHFQHLRPTELWATEFLPSITELKIFSLYQNIDWVIQFFGCHTVSTGESPTKAMKQFAVYADGRQLNQDDIAMLIDELSQKATDIYRHIRQMDFESLKLLVMRQECYQFKMLCDAAGADWQPTAEMVARIENQPLLTGLFPTETFIETAESFNEIFGIKKFANEVLKEKI